MLDLIWAAVGIAFHQYLTVTKKSFADIQDSSNNVLRVWYHFYCWGGFFYLSWLGNYLRKGRGFSEDEMKIYAVLPFVAGIFGLTGLLSVVGRIVFGVAADRIGRAPSATISYACTAVGTLCLLTLETWRHAAPLYAYAILFGLG